MLYDLKDKKPKNFGENWIAPNAVIDGGCEIGNNCFVGTSSLVRNNFPDNCMLIGSPAKILRKMSKS